MALLNAGGKTNRWQRAIVRRVRIVRMPAIITTALGGRC